MAAPQKKPREQTIFLDAVGARQRSILQRIRRAHVRVQASLDPAPIVDLRQVLARRGKAETACPAATIKYWKWLATVAPAADAGPAKYFVPWWRVLKDGKLSPHMPGGIARQRALLRAEGVVGQ
jgi:6-O-methylguanine DNA methyltransferase, DNA binding domain